ncbi:MAG: hypothetical protein ACPGVK_02555 [Halocynthiibacter sp.]
MAKRLSQTAQKWVDAARVLPVVGTMLMVFPVLRFSGRPENDGTASGMLYLFAVWVVLIVLSCILSSKMRSRSQDQSDG